MPEGFERVMSKLRKLADLAALARGKYIVVGFSAAYGIYVHENLEAFHPNGQAKFLSRALSEATGDKARAALRRGIGLIDALLLEALDIQAHAQSYCPVFTGNLRASAFTEVREGD